MKTKTLLILVLILVMASSLFVGTAAASSAEVPFKSTIHPSPQLSMVENCLGMGPGLFGPIPGEGQATHLGEVTWYADMWACFDGTQFGIMKFTSADGDQLFGEFEGTWSGMPPGLVTFQGTFWITSGTGRFKGMTATGTYSGTSQEGVSSILYFDGRLTK